MAQHQNILRAALWMVGATLSFSAMAIAGREAARELDTFELMLYRSAFGFVVVLIVIGSRPGGFSIVSTRNIRQHLYRNAAHYAAQNFWFYGVAVIPLAQLVAFEFTNPIWVAIIAPIMLGETLTRLRIIAVVLGFLGILIVAQPGYAPLHWGHAAGLMAAIGFALNSLFTRRILEHETVWAVLFWMTLLQTLASLLISLPGGITIPDQTILPVAAVAVLGLTAHICLTSALGQAPATVVAPMEFARLPVLAMAGALIYGESLMVTVFIGAAFILVGNILSIRAERRHARVMGDNT